jgi:hypothetical protein
MMVDGIQRIYDGWNPSGEITTASQSKSNIVRTRPLSTLHLEPTHLLYYSDYTAALGAHSPPLLH